LVQKELLRIQKENAELEATLNASSNNIAQLKSKGANYDTVHARATSLEREVETTRHRAELVQSSLDQMIIERDTATSKMLELKSAVEVLTVDKSYLTREVSASATKCSNLEETVNSLREEKRNLMNIKQQYQEELLKEKDDARRGYEDRLSMEVNKLQKETAMELSSIRNAQKQVHEMEIASLKDRLASAEELNATHLTELNELRQTHESLLMNTSRERNDHQSSMSELRSRLKIKAFEQGRLNLLVEEQREALASSRLSIAKHEKRFSVLRDEFVKLEAQGAKREIEHEAMLNIEREKVLGYEALEMELDGAFISGGNSSTSTLLPVSRWCFFLAITSFSRLDFSQKYLIFFFFTFSYFSFLFFSALLL
jgi:chromosome segregation ATPase